ncbi:MAG: DUF4019 domain-containing protein [Myxococcaceae bacterium]
MTSGPTLIACLLLSAGAPAAQSTEASEAAGQQAAESWLKLIDAGQLGTAWDQSSTTFRTVVPRRDFEKKMKAARGPLGKFLFRKLSGKKLTHSIPGAPGGTYVIVEYSAQFQKREHAVETVTMMFDTGGKFRGAGYDVR